jgi:transposase
MHILGTDIAKQSFEVALRGGSPGQQAAFANKLAGFKQLSQWLADQQVSELHVCMEATGVYYEALATYLVEQGHTVSVVNPWQIKAFADSKLRRHKTDRLDADLIAEFCQKEQPRPWQPLSPAEHTLPALVRHRDSLVESRQQQLNRRESSRDDLVTTSLQRVIDHLAAEIAQVEQQIQKQIEQQPDLKEKQELLMSIPGIGQQTATQLLAEMPNLATYPSAKQAAAHAGLTPAHRSSGTSVHDKPHLSKIGNPRVRKILYFPALAAMRYNPIIKAHRERLLKQGKAKMVAVGAAMRKLLHLAYGVLKNKKPFDPAYVN